MNDTETAEYYFPDESRGPTFCPPGFIQEAADFYATLATKPYHLAFGPMLRAAAFHGKPSRYVDDLLVIDRRILEKYRYYEFLWLIRDNGTHLYELTPENTQSIVDALQYAIGTWAHQGPIVFTWDGAQLREMMCGLQTIIDHFEASLEMQRTAKVVK